MNQIIKLEELDYNLMNYIIDVNYLKIKINQVVKLDKSNYN